MRDLWQTKLKLNGIKSLLNRALRKQGIRVSIAKHHPFKMTSCMTEVAEVATQIKSKEHEIQELKQNIRSMQEDMQDVLEVLRVVKRNGGRVGRDKTVSDEKRNFTIYHL
jgi:hypothetical protein